MYISDIEITEEWRGGGLGLFAIEELLKPIHASRPNDQVALIRVGSAGLERHFSRMGFETVVP